MRRVYREGGYPCGECSEVFPTPAGLGGHRSSHRSSPATTERLPPPLDPIVRYCECGGALTLRGETDRTVSAVIEDAWDIAHDGDGHGPCSAADATLIRYSRTRAGAAR